MGKNELSQQLTLKNLWDEKKFKQKYLLFADKSYLQKPNDGCF